MYDAYILASLKWRSLRTSHGGACSVCVSAADACDEIREGSPRLAFQPSTRSNKEFKFEEGTISSKKMEILEAK